MIQYYNGKNLLQEQAEALVNTVNCIGIMGKGIALQFKKTFPDNFKAYEKACKKNEVQVGKMFVFETHSMFGPKYIINFPTKKHWKEMSSIQYIDEGLDDLKKIISNYNIKSIAIPPLGCGNGGLEWHKVRELINKKLNSLVDTNIIVFEPGQTPAIKSVKIPAMNSNRAAMLVMLANYISPAYELTKLEIQKLMYFLQMCGQPLNLKFEKYHYGPYANNLNHVLDELDGFYLNGVGDRTENRPITLVIERLHEAESIVNNNEEILQRIQRVKEIIEGYETPFGLELLATVHWTMKHENKHNVKDIVGYIHKWSFRKSGLFKEQYINRAVEWLSRFDLLTPSLQPA